MRNVSPALSPYLPAFSQQDDIVLHDYRRNSKGVYLEKTDHL